MKPILCLLIDDDSEESEIFHFALEELQGMQVKCHSIMCGREAVSVLRNTSIHPDYIFLDLNMPKMDGKQCLKEIRSIEKLAQVPVILYSTSFIDGQKQELQKLGATGFITKTTGIIELQHELLRCFAKVEREASHDENSPVQEPPLISLLIPAAGGNISTQPI